MVSSFPQDASAMDRESLLFRIMPETFRSSIFIVS
jgi:hypothetical protein